MLLDKIINDKDIILNSELTDEYKSYLPVSDNDTSIVDQNRDRMKQHGKGTKAHNLEKKRGFMYFSKFMRAIDSSYAATGEIDKYSSYLKEMAPQLKVMLTECQYGEACDALIKVDDADRFKEEGHFVATHCPDCSTHFDDTAYKKVANSIDLSQLYRTLKQKSDPQVAISVCTMYMVNLGFSPAEVCRIGSMKNSDWKVGKTETQSFIMCASVFNEAGMCSAIAE